MEEAASTLGARPLAAFWAVTAPLTLRAAAAAWLLAFVLGVSAFITLPFVVRLMAGAFANLPPQLEEAAATLGARPLRAFLLITLPLAAPGAIAAAVLAVDRLVGFTRTVGRS